VIADHAQAEIMFRLVGSAAPIREALRDAVAERAEIREVFGTPAQRLESFPGLETTVVSFATDIPSFGGAWGKPLLIGPGSIHVAHTAEEQISKRQLMDAVEIYARMVRSLISETHKN
jgi:acetylornithine deacetylase